MNSSYIAAFFFKQICGNERIDSSAYGNGNFFFHSKKELFMGRIFMARGGHAGTQSSQTLHLLWSKFTIISGRLMESAPVGQTAVQAPQWVHLSLSRFTSWEAF
jgi:hypothetical protein